MQNPLPLRHWCSPWRALPDHRYRIPTSATRNVISGNTNIGINLSNGSNSNIVQGNYIGTNAAGTGDLGNTNIGIGIYGSSGNTIGGSVSGAGNVISGTGTSGTSADGVYLDATSGSTIIQGNIIGLNAAGTAAIANQGNGIEVLSSGNTIGGTTSLTRNVISGNAMHGILVIGANAFNNTIQGNYIGTSSAGTSDLGNTTEGISIESGAYNNIIGGSVSGAGNVVSGNNSDGIEIIGTGATGNTVRGNIVGLNAAGTAVIANSNNGVRIATGNNTIGGTNALERNIISGNASDGIDITGVDAVNNTIVNNFIGTDITGLVDLGNTLNGIRLENGASNNTIGGSTASARNVISGNDSDGIDIAGSNTLNSIIIGNYIGVGASGTTAIGNLADGISIKDSTSVGRIGGTAVGEGNTIANNSAGVEVKNGAQNAAILGNSIYSNNSQGIDIEGDNIILANDIGDTDSGANNRQNFPILKTATSSGGNTTIAGKVSGLASTTFRLEFFKNSYGQADASGYGEARTYLGSASITTDATGNFNFSQLLNGVVLNTGDIITATATVDLGGGSFGPTSEFSGNILANKSNLMITGTYTGTGGDDRTFLGLGFRPEAVIIMQPGGSTATPSYLKTSSMAGDSSKDMYGATALQPTSSIARWPGIYGWYRPEYQRRNIPLDRLWCRRQHRLRCLLR